MKKKYILARYPGKCYVCGKTWLPGAKIKQRSYARGPYRHSHCQPNHKP